MKLYVSLAVLLLSNSAFSKTHINPEHLIGTITVTENFEKSFNDNTTGGSSSGATPPPNRDRVEETRKVISITKELIALGESIYELVKKGKPTTTTEYAPISVVPRDPTTKEYVDPFSLEGFSIPEERSFTAKITNALGKEVVHFEYTLIYSYGGSFNGTGKYLTNVIIVPKKINTNHGWDFTATMKLSGVMNHGTKENPIAGVLVTMKYQLTSWSASYERNDTIHVSGRGEVKSFGLK